MQVVRRFVPAIAAALTLVAAAPAGAAVRELGVPTGQRLPAASCPTDCQVLARVTGYQVQIGRAKNPYQITRKGTIVAFTIALGKPSQTDTTGFNNLFGAQSQARISILHLGRRQRRATLTAQSPVYNLTPYFGSSPTFALAKPLKVRPRDVVALTIPSWAPTFAVGLGSDHAWRAPRDPDDCEDLETPATHQTLKSVRRYQCFYRTAQLLYSATFIPDPRPTNPPPRSNNSNRR
jgi:hypothetical protein